jgi:hypothetical protein
MICSNVDEMIVEKNKRCTICLMNRPDSARDWQLGIEYDFISVEMIVQDGVRLDTKTPSAAFTGRVACDDDPQTALDLLGI